MENANECKKLLDNGHMVVLFRNSMGSYTAAALQGPAEGETPSESDLLATYPYAVVVDAIDDMEDFARTVTDDFEPGKALHRLTEKVLATGDYQAWPPTGFESA